MKALDTIHGEYVHLRRVRLLAAHFADLIPPGASVLDVGCGDGRLARLIQAARPDISISGLDVLVRPHTAIPVQPFDGEHIPCGADSFDVAMFVDVLHHTTDPMILLRESARASRLGVLIKDHLADGWMARPTLRFMDRVSNLRHGVVLPYNYWTHAQWQSAFAALQLKTLAWKSKLGLYPWPANLVFGRKLHFVALLGKPSPSENAL